MFVFKVLLIADLVMGHLVDFAPSNADQEVIGKQTSLLGKAVLDHLDRGKVLISLNCVLKYVDMSF